MSESNTKAPQDQVAQGGPKGMTELKVSGHLMTFDAGVYCIFTPGNSPVSDPNTGLPGIRLSAPPGPAFRPDAITISTFRDDGWMGGANGAALVRVTRGPAHVLVTIYQAPNAKGDAPKLQIMKIMEAVAATPAAQQAAPAAQAPAPVPAPVAPPPAPVPAPAPAAAPQNTPAGGAAQTVTDPSQAEIVAHIQTRGDVVARLSDWMGNVGSKHWIEGFAISPKAMIGPGDIEYQAVLGRGWLSPWAEGGQFCGSRGMSLPILGLRVRLRGEAAERLDCVVSASFVDGTRIGPLDTGEPCQAESLAPLEAFHVEIRERGAEPEAVTGADEAPKSPGRKSAAAKAPAKSAPAKPPAKSPAKTTRSK